MAGMHDIARTASLKDENVAAVFAAVVDAAKKGEKVFIKGIGTFRMATQAARTIRSPQIPGGVSEVPERQVLKFKSSPTLKDALNAGGKAKGTPAAKTAKAPAKPAAAKPAPVAAKAAPVAAKAAPAKAPAAKPAPAKAAPVAAKPAPAKAPAKPAVKKAPPPPAAVEEATEEAPAEEAAAAEA